MTAVQGKALKSARVAFVAEYYSGLRLAIVGSGNGIVYPMLNLQWSWIIPNPQFWPPEGISRGSFGPEIHSVVGLDSGQLMGSSAARDHPCDTPLRHHRQAERRMENGL